MGFSPGLHTGGGFGASLFVGLGWGSADLVFFFFALLIYNALYNNCEF